MTTTTWYTPEEKMPEVGKEVIGFWRSNKDINVIVVDTITFDGVERGWNTDMGIEAYPPDLWCYKPERQ